MTQSSSFNHGSDLFCGTLQQDSRVFIKNVDTQLKQFAIEDYNLPATINNGQWQNSYVCSPYTALNGYCMEELEKVNNRLFRMLVRPLIRLVGGYMKRRDINKNIHINNWMLSTNLYPNKMSGRDLATDTQTWSNDFPDHALIFRSLNDFNNRTLIDNLKKTGYLLMPSRQVYLYDKTLSDIQKRHNVNVDAKLLTRNDYSYVPASDILASDIARIVELYNYLYIAKYSQFNPMFSEKFIEHLLQNPHFELYGFRNKQGELDAVGGRFSIDNVTSLPIVGYDTNLPAKLGLYRRVLIATNLHALESNLTFNASSGASHFKILRGATPFIEYSAIYIAHLPKARQSVWRLINALLTRIGVPIIQKYQL